MSDSVGNERGSIALGLALTAVLHGVVVALCMGLAHFLRGDASVGLAPFGFIGVLQFGWMGPAFGVAAHFKHRRTLRGLWIGAEITFLLNAACAGVVFLQFL